MTEIGARVRADVPPAVLRCPALENFDLTYREPSPALEDLVDYHWIVEWSGGFAYLVVRPETGLTSPFPLTVSLVVTPNLGELRTG
ncbi:MAG TPA: hypothetical protein VFG96_10220 [Jiangellaceae bacterium]|nr:hypothetical protein [Jiangellaceae bacterium]